MMLGTLETGATIPVCVEFKNAHANDLHHGIEIQLPAYMRDRGADFGIFGVFYFRCDEFDNPKKTIYDLSLELEEKRRRIGLNIRIVVFDVSPQEPPSRR